jgi:hypothetical protein
MKTQDLIAALSAHPAPVRPAQSLRMLWWAGVSGALLALLLMLGTIGLNPELGATASSESMFWVKLGFVVSTALVGFAVMLRLAQPGRAVGRASWLLGAPAAAVWLAAAATLVSAPPSERSTLIFGGTALVCPWLIAGFSLPSFLLLLLALRSLAPTNLRAAGAVAGLLAGALGASVYQFHCPELAAPFLGIWYVLGMLIPAAIGALVGPRVLRW